MKVIKACLMVEENRSSIATFKRLKPKCKVDTIAKTVTEATKLQVKPKMFESSKRVIRFGEK